METTPATILAEIRTMIAIARDNRHTAETVDINAVIQAVERLTDLVETLVPTEREIPV